MQIGDCAPTVHESNVFIALGLAPPSGNPATMVSAEPPGTIEPVPKEYRTIRSLISA